MRTLIGTLYSRPTFARLVLAAGILVLPLALFTVRKQMSESSMAPSMLLGDLPSPELVRPAKLGLGKICFQRGPWIYLSDLVTGQETKLVEGEGAELASTGKWLAFLDVKESEGIKNQIFPPAGRLRVLDLRTMNVRDFSTLRDTHALDPIWSNDGTKIAVTLASDELERSDIAVFDPATGESRKLTASTDVGTDGMYVDSWTPDDRSILFHSLRALYEVRLDGGPVEKVPVDQLFENGAISSSSRFSLSPDRRLLLFSSMLSTSEEPANAIISVFDLNTKTVRRVLPKLIQGTDPMWLPSNEILFTRLEWDENKLAWRSSVSKIDIDGARLTTLVADARLVSYSKQ